MSQNCYSSWIVDNFIRDALAQSNNGSFAVLSYKGKDYGAIIHYLVSNGTILLKVRRLQPALDSKLVGAILERKFNRFVVEESVSLEDKVSFRARKVGDRLTALTDEEQKLLMSKGFY